MTENPSPAEKKKEQRSSGTSGTGKQNEAPAVNNAAGSGNKVITKGKKSIPVVQQKDFGSFDDFDSPDESEPPKSGNRVIFLKGGNFDD